MARADLARPEARRIALAAAGFARPRPTRVDGRAVLDVVRRLGLLQIDPINVLVPAQYLPLFSRLGPYRRELLDDLVHRRRALTEGWAHAASIVPVDDLPMIRQRNHDDDRVYAPGRFLRKHAAFAATVLDELRGRGPLAAEDIADPPGTPKPRAGDWRWTMARFALEAHLAFGTVAVVGRRGDRSRLYDLAERVHAPARAVDADQARRALLARAGRALGVATAHDLADYYRVPVKVARPRIAELVEEGTLRAVQVDGWREPAFLDGKAKLPARIDTASLLSPFDPLVWFRPRTERLFDFEYRIEIYVPAAKRRWGYYVLPFLFGDRLVARVDLRRDGARLRVVGAHREPGAPRGVAEALRVELGHVATWLGLDGVIGAPRWR